MAILMNSARVRLLSGLNSSVLLTIHRAISFCIEILAQFVSMSVVFISESDVTTYFGIVNIVVIRVPLAVVAVIDTSFFILSIVMLFEVIPPAVMAFVHFPS
jgi:hypothetical protein